MPTPDRLDEATAFLRSPDVMLCGFGRMAAEAGGVLLETLPGADRIDALQETVTRALRGIIEGGFAASVLVTEEDPPSAEEVYHHAWHELFPELALAGARDHEHLEAHEIPAARNVARAYANALALPHPPTDKVIDALWFGRSRYVWITLHPRYRRPLHPRRAPVTMHVLTPLSDVRNARNNRPMVASMHRTLVERAGTYYHPTQPVILEDDPRFRHFAVTEVTDLLERHGISVTPEIETQAAMTVADVQAAHSLGMHSGDLGLLQLQLRTELVQRLRAH